MYRDDRAFFTNPYLGQSGSRKNALLDTREQGTMAKIVKGTGSMKIVIRKQ